ARRGERRDRVLVRVRSGDGGREDRRVRGDADDVPGRDELGEVAGTDAPAGEVVEPDAHAEGAELGGAADRHGTPRSRWCTSFHPRPLRPRWQVAGTVRSGP